MLSQHALIIMQVVGVTTVPGGTRTSQPSYDNGGASPIFDRNAINNGTQHMYQNHVNVNKQKGH